MKRDMDLVRKIVLAIEGGEHGRVADTLKIDGYTEEQIGYHAYLLIDSGLAVGINIGDRGSESPEWMVTHLTSAGHDFADASRDDTRWSKAKTVVKEKAGTVTVEVMKQILVGLMKSAVGL